MPAKKTFSLTASAAAPRRIEGAPGAYKPVTIRPEVMRMLINYQRSVHSERR